MGSSAKKVGRTHLRDLSAVLLGWLSGGTGICCGAAAGLGLSGLSSGSGERFETVSVSGEIGGVLEEFSDTTYPWANRLKTHYNLYSVLSGIH